MRKKELPPLEVVKGHVSYDPATGEFTHLRLCRRADIKGAVGYRRVNINRQPYVAHRIAWLIMTGEDPGQQDVDHIDGDRSNNRWDNLRLATRAENSGNNRKALGITYVKDKKKWRANIMVSGVKYLRYNVCPLLARIDYEDMSRELRGEYSPV